MGARNRLQKLRRRARCDDMTKRRGAGSHLNEEQDQSAASERGYPAKQAVRKRRSLRRPMILCHDPQPLVAKDGWNMAPLGDTVKN